MSEDISAVVIETIAKPTEQDSAWKEVINVWFPEFMLFFYPELAAKIDWSAGYESLDKELQKITTQAMLGKRFVDKLMKVKSKEGEEFWVLLHIEIQGAKEVGFEKRLFEYYYRLHDRYHVPILTLAVLADDNASWRPSVYEAKVWETKVLSFYFSTIKLLDYSDRREFLDQTNNPFGVIVLAQLVALNTKKDPNARFDAKFGLTRRLYDKGLNRDAILNLYRFLDWVLTLPEKLEIRYNELIHQIEEERAVTYITSAERIGIKKGYEQGIQQGIDHERVLLSRILTRRFGTLSANNLNKLKQADPNTLLVWGDRIFDVKTIEDVFAE